MKEIIKKINIYKFEELSEEIQKKLIEEEKEKMISDFCEFELEYEMKEKAKELLMKYFKNNADFNRVYYDLSYSQGSGSMIEFELQYYNKSLIIKHSGHYYHELSFTIIENNDFLTDKQHKQLKEKICRMNGELTKHGYKLIEYYWNADEEAKENLKQYDFLENGTIY